MKKYSFLLFDADNTLLDFDENERTSLTDTFRVFGIPFDEDTIRLYHGINLMYWKMLSEKKISKEELLIKRFATLFERIGVDADPVATENHYRTLLGKGCQVVPGALEVCRKLRNDYRLYVITNGVASTQHSRLEGSGVAALMDGIFLSEKLGIEKPNAGFFEKVFAAISPADLSEIMIVGDSLTSDIRGGMNAGIRTCWYNPEKKPLPDAYTADLIISDLRELTGFLLPE